MKQVETLILQFNTKLKQREISLFRGAVIAKLAKNNILYHNHIDDGFRYNYPLVQYKILDGKTSIVYVGIEGANAASDFMSANDLNLQIGTQLKIFQFLNIKTDKINLGIAESSNTYFIKHWLPFNAKNFTSYKKSKSIVDTAQLLEKILLGNILSFLKSQLVFVEEKIQVNITDIIKVNNIKFKDIHLLCMDVLFCCNVFLPSYIGLGKHSSIGYGTLFRKNDIKK